VYVRHLGALGKRLPPRRKRLVVVPRSCVTRTEVGERHSRLLAALDDALQCGRSVDERPAAQLSHRSVEACDRCCGKVGAERLDHRRLKRCLEIEWPTQIRRAHGQKELGVSRGLRRSDLERLRFHDRSACGERRPKTVRARR
jgi:hypothetical protein